MPRIAIALGLSFLVTIVFMFALRPVAEAIGLVDRPGGRKTHVGNIPIIGGLAMFPGLALAAAQAFPTLEQYAWFFSALSLLIIVGAIDDRFDLPASVRLLAQTCAVMIMMLGSDVQVHILGALFSHETLGLSGFSGVFTILIALTAINAFNMFDGSDGIAGIQALVSMLLLGAMCIMAGSTQSLILIAGAAGCVLAFLTFNWPSKHTTPIKCFMGDAGSTMLGFLLAWLSIHLSQQQIPVIAPVAALWIFSLPLFDFFSSMLRRTLAGRSPFHGDSQHLHHQLRQLGLSSRRVAQVILCASGGLGIFGLAGFVNNFPDSLMFALWLMLGAIYHVVFGTNLVFSKKTSGQAGQSGTYPTLWRKGSAPVEQAQAGDREASLPTLQQRSSTAASQSSELGH